MDWITNGTWPTGVRGAQAAAGVVVLVAATLLLCAGYLADRIVEVVLQVHTAGKSHQLAERVIGARWFWSIPIALIAFGIFAGVVDEVREGNGRGLFTMVVLGAIAVLAGCRTDCSTAS